MFFASVSATAFVVLAVLVMAGTTRALDSSARQLFRPDDVWGANQLIFGNFVDGLGPPYAAGVLLVAGVVSAVRARSPRPVGFVVLLAVTALILTAVSKVIIDRPDPHGAMTGFGGAFPSGHMLTLLVSLGGAILVLSARSRWWQWAVLAAVGITMAVSLLFLATHLLTDVVGGTLLALTVLPLASVDRLRALARCGIKAHE